MKIIFKQTFPLNALKHYLLIPIKTNHDINFMFLFKNIIFPTRSGFKLVLFDVIQFPTSLNNRSYGVEVAGTQKYFFANNDNVGKFFSLSFHQSSGFISFLT